MGSVTIPQNMNHTPEPWGFGNGRDGERLILGDNGNGNYVCNVQIHQTPRAMGMLDEEEREANARLIKAAPDMLEALKAQHEAIDLLFARVIQLDTSFFPSKSGKTWEAMLQGNKAIAKAEGK